MSDAVKWAAIAAILVVLIALVLTTPFMSQYFEGVAFVNNFTTYVGEFLSVLGSTFLYARQLLNNFLPADLVSITIALSIARKPLYMLVETTSNTIRAIYK